MCPSRQNPFSSMYKLGQCHDSTVLDFPTTKTKQDKMRRKKKPTNSNNLRIYIRISSC